jgi:hypothetical protein
MWCHLQQMLPAAALQHPGFLHKPQADQTVHLVGLEGKVLLVIPYLAPQVMVAEGWLP